MREQAGKYIIWDRTNAHTCAASYVHQTSIMAGGVDELAAIRQRAKYSGLHHTRLCPMVFDSMGPINRSGLDSIAEVGLKFPASRLRKTTFSDAFPSTCTLNGI